MNRVRTILYKSLKTLILLIGSLLLFCSIFILTIRTPWAQNKIVDYAVKYVSNKTNSEIQIKRLYITFSGNIELDDLMLKDQNNSVLFSSEELEIGLAISSLFKQKLIVSPIRWKGVNATVIHNNEGVYNFDFLIDVFASNDTEFSEENSTQPSSFVIDINDIDLQDFNFHYRDQLAGIEAKFAFEKFHLGSTQLNLDEPTLYLHDFVFQNSVITIDQFAEGIKIDEEKKDTTQSALPKIIVDRLAWNNTSFRYTNRNDSIDIDINIVEYVLQDFAVQNHTIRLVSSTLSNSIFSIQLPSNPQIDTLYKQESTQFNWPDWDIEIGKLVVVNNVFKFNKGPISNLTSGFNPDHIGLNDINLNLSDFKLADNDFRVKLNELRFQEQSGFVLKNTSIDLLQISDQHLILDSIRITTNHSDLFASVKLDYTSISQLINDALTSTSINATVLHSRLSLYDAIYFDQSLKEDSLVQKIKPYPFRLHTAISGTVDSLAISSFTLHGLKSTRLEWSGLIKNITKINSLEYNLPSLFCHIPKSDIKLISGKTIRQLPNYIEISSVLKGGLNALSTSTLLSIPEGAVTISGQFGDFNTLPYYNGNLNATALNLNKWVNNADLQPVSFSLNFKGKGNDLSNVFLQTDLSFSKLKYAQTDLRMLRLNTSVKDQKVDLHLTHHGKEIYADLFFKASLDSVLSKIKLDMTIQKADIQALGFSDVPLIMEMDVKADFDGNKDKFTSSLSFTKGSFTREGISYELIPILCKFINQPNKTDLTIQSGMLNGSLTSNGNIQSLLDNTEGYIARRFKQDTTASLSPDLKLEAHFQIGASSILNNILLPELERIDNLLIDIDFQPDKDIFKASLLAPYIIYGETSIEKTAIYLHTKKDSIYGDFGFYQLISGAVSIPETNLAIGWKGNNADMILSIKEIKQDTKLEHAYIALKGNFYDDSVLVNLVPDRLILEGEQWTVKSTNKVIVSDQLVYFSDFEINNKDQKISLATDIYNQMHRLKINFNEFSISTISTLFDVDGGLANGVVDGEVSILGMNATPALLAAITIKEFEAYDVFLGTLTLNADNLQEKKYKADLSLTGPNIDFLAEGNYTTIDDEHKIDLSVDVNYIQLSLIESFSEGQLKNTAGKLQGYFDIIGTLDKPSYDGSMYFNQAAFTLASLNAPFLLSDEKITINNDGLNFNQFTIIDAHQQKANVNGKIVTTESLINPRFDLSVIAKRFQILNSERADNDLFYGKILVDTDTKVTGNLTLPIVRINMRLLNETNVSYIIPETEIAVEERNSVVVFENKKDTVTVKVEEKPSLEGFEGVDLKVFLLIDPKTTFNIIFDERSGDKITVSGEANLSYNLQANGTMELSGRYIVTGGAYEMSLYDLVKKKFDLGTGSTITWTGDPFMAALDMTAKYRVRTSSMDLMADQLTGADAGTITRYRQELPFDVLLYIGGDTYQPEISFGLDMPDDHKDVLEGNVFRRLQQLKEDENKLNKQVFSLIVFNRFLPSNMGNDDGGGNMAGLARSSVSKMLSSQLNQLSEKYIKTVELNVDMDSYTDYRSGTAQDRTQVNLSVRKTLFDDRIVIKVGSQVGVEGNRQQSNRSNEIIGDVTLEYLLDKEGRYRAKAFRKNEFEDLVEGQILITGLSLLFNKEFNTVEDLKNERKTKKELKNQVD